MTREEQKLINRVRDILDAIDKKNEAVTDEPAPLNVLSPTRREELRYTSLVLIGAGLKLLENAEGELPPV